MWLGRVFLFGGGGCPFYVVTFTVMPDLNMYVNVLRNAKASKTKDHLVGAPAASASLAGLASSVLPSRAGEASLFLLSFLEAASPSSAASEKYMYIIIIFQSTSRSICTYPAPRPSCPPCPPRCPPPLSVASTCRRRT